MSGVKVEGFFWFASQTLDEMSEAAAGDQICDRNNKKVNVALNWVIHSLTIYTSSTSTEEKTDVLHYKYVTDVQNCKRKIPLYLFQLFLPLFV